MLVTFKNYRWRFGMPIILLFAVMVCAVCVQADPLELKKKSDQETFRKPAPVKTEQEPVLKRQKKPSQPESDSKVRTGKQMSPKPRHETPPGIRKKKFQTPELMFPEGPPKFRKAEITQLVVGTKDNGGWTWTATVKNTGTSVLDGRKLGLQGFSSPPSYNWKPASGSIISQSDIQPGQSVMVTRNWTRCCMTYYLKVELRDRLSNNNIMDTKLISKGLWSKQPASSGYPFGVFITKIEWDSSAKTWRATVTNHSVFKMKIKVRGYYKSQGTENDDDFVAFGQEEFLVGVNEERTTRSFPILSAENGDTIRVYAWYPSPCGEELEDCYVGNRNGNPYKEITIPNSNEFPPI